MTLNYNGEAVEAYRLVMTKENALEILSGKKTVEIRKFSPYYDKMFTDVEKLGLNAELREQGRDAECVAALKDIGAVRFTNYNGSWHLDALIDEIGISELTDDGIAFMNEEFGFHELDESLEKHKAEFGKPESEEDIPLFFYLHISEIIGQEGLK